MTVLLLAIVPCHCLTLLVMTVSSLPCLQLCSSYPKILAVPATIEDAVLKVVATYRDGGRLPVLSYLRTSTVLVNGEETVVKVRICQHGRAFGLDTAVPMHM
jgi:hypothetical protein